MMKMAYWLAAILMLSILASCSAAAAPTQSPTVTSSDSLNTQESSTAPRDTKSEGGVAAIIPFGQTVVVRYTDGTAVWWGAKPRDVDPTVLKAVSQSATHTLYLLTDGTLRASGKNDMGQLNTPQGLSDVLEVVAGEGFSLAVTKNGSLVGWGAYKLQTQNNEYALKPYPEDRTDVESVSVSQHYTLVRHRDQTYTLWGDDYEPVYGNFDLATLTGVHTAVLRGKNIIYLTQEGVLSAYNPTDNTTLTYESSPVSRIIQGTDPLVAQLRDGSFRIVGDKDLSEPLALSFAPDSPVATIATLVIGVGENSKIRAYDRAQADQYGEFWSSVNRTVAFPAQLPGVQEILIAQIGNTSHLLAGVARMADGSVRVYSTNTEVTAFPYEAVNSGKLIAGEGYVGSMTRDGVPVLWGTNWVRSKDAEIPAWIGPLLQVQVSTRCSIGLRTDGTVVVWSNDSDCESSQAVYQATDIPAEVTNIVKVLPLERRASQELQQFSVLRNDGVIVRWGNDAQRERVIDQRFQQVIDVQSNRLTDMYLHRDGRVTVQFDGTDLAVPAQVRNVKRIALHDNMVALRDDGVVVVWNDKFVDEYPGFRDVIDLDTWRDSVFVTHSDGRIDRWGSIFDIPASVGEMEFVQNMSATSR